MKTKFVYFLFDIGKSDSCRLCHADTYNNQPCKWWCIGRMF